MTPKMILVIAAVIVAIISMIHPIAILLPVAVILAAIAVISP